jgi:hypothetical protein
MAEDDKRSGGGPRTRLKAQTTNSVGKALPHLIHCTVSLYAVKVCPQVSGSGSGRASKYFNFTDRDSTFVSFSNEFFCIILTTTIGLKYLPDPSLNTVQFFLQLLISLLKHTYW